MSGEDVCSVLDEELLQIYVDLKLSLEKQEDLSQWCGLSRIMGVVADSCKRESLKYASEDRVGIWDYLMDCMERQSESKYMKHLSNLMSLAQIEVDNHVDVPSGMASSMSTFMSPNFEGLSVGAVDSLVVEGEKRQWEPKQKIKSYIYNKSDLDADSAPSTGFVSALERLEQDTGRVTRSNNKKRLTSHFQTPFVEKDSEFDAEKSSNRARNKKSGKSSEVDRKIDELDKFDNEIKERILNEILNSKPGITFEDISGLAEVKQVLQEMIILPALHPELFRGILSPPRGLLLFGPPGNGKTMIARAIAAEAKMTFFSISASVLCSKWIGEGEKAMRALFIIARAKAPSFIFIDEIDSILGSRGNDEHESSRRLKNEFLLQFDGVISDSSEGVTVMGATNRPFDLDEAARRRFTKRIYVPLPEPETRRKLLNGLVLQFKNDLTAAHIDLLVDRTEGYSCSDISNLTKDAAYQPIRQVLKSGQNNLLKDPHLIRPVSLSDFFSSLNTIKPSVASEECQMYEDFKYKFGSSGNA